MIKDNRAKQSPKVKIRVGVNSREESVSLDNTKYDTVSLNSNPSNKEKDNID